MHIMSTNFVKMLVWKDEYDVKLWRQKERTANTNDHHMPLIEKKLHEKFLRTPLHVAYNFGCRALYNMPWRASVSSHQVQWNIPTFEACFKKYVGLPVSAKMQKV